MCLLAGRSSHLSGPSCSLLRPEEARLLSTSCQAGSTHTGATEQGLGLRTPPPSSPRTHPTNTCLVFNQQERLRGVNDQEQAVLEQVW